MSVNILNDIKEKGYGVRKTIMDDDTITIQNTNLLLQNS